MPKREADYWRIVRELTDEINAGKLKPGQQLPKIDELAATYAVSRSTVQRALSILDDRGLTEGHQGKGIFVCDRSGAPR